MEGGKAGGIPALEKGGVVGRGGGNIITTVSLHHIGEKEIHNISMFYNNLSIFCNFLFFWGGVLGILSHFPRIVFID